MKLILLIVGIVLSIWVSTTIYTPTKTFVTDIQKTYLKSKAIQNTVTQKSGIAINTITEGYKEIARVFGVEVAEETAKKEVSTPVASGTSDPIEKLFTYNLALWISVFAGVMTMSIYANILSLILFFLKPITFFIK